MYVGVLFFMFAEAVVLLTIPLVVIFSLTR